MDTFSMLLIALATLAAAVYAHTRIPRFTAGRRNVLITRAVLATVGVASGAVSAGLYGVDALHAVLAFLAGFGAVHVPAAFILLIKWGRGAGQT